MNTPDHPKDEARRVPPEGALANAQAIGDSGLTSARPSRRVTPILARVSGLKFARLSKQCAPVSGEGRVRVYNY